MEDTPIVFWSNGRLCRKIYKQQLIRKSVGLMKALLISSGLCNAFRIQKCPWREFTSHKIKSSESPINKGFQSSFKLPDFSFRIDSILKHPSSYLLLRLVQKAFFQSPLLRVIVNIAFSFQDAKHLVNSGFDSLFL